MSLENRIFLDETAIISTFENNLVSLKTADGKLYKKLEPRKLFPVSRPEEYVTLLTEAGKEIAVIKKLSDLNSESYHTIAQSLESYYLVPFITDILSITQKSGTMIWVVETNRGIKRFEVRDRNHDIKTAASGTVRIRDADDNRYIISDYRKLSKKSIGLLLADI